MLHLQPGQHGLNNLEEIFGMERKLHELDKIEILEDVVLIQEVKNGRDMLQYPRMSGFPEELLQDLMFHQPLDQNWRKVMPQSGNPHQLSKYLKANDLLLHLRVVSQQPVHQPKNVLLSMFGVFCSNICNIRCVLFYLSLLHQQEVLHIYTFLILL